MPFFDKLGTYKMKSLLLSFPAVLECFLAGKNTARKEDGSVKAADVINWSALAKPWFKNPDTVINTRSAAVP